MINIEALFEHSAGDPKAGIVTITPELAGLLLEKHNDNNRNQRGRAVADMVRDLVEGDWALNGETIKISKTGRVLDGQHRLLAILLGDKPMRTFVIIGLDDEAQDTMDSGIKRTTGDVLKLHGEKDVNVLAAIIRRLWLWQRGDRKLASNPVPTKTETSDFLEANPGIRESVRVAGRVYSNFPHLSKTAVGVAHFLTDQVDAEKAEWFFERLADGAVDDPSHPVVTLRNRMIKDNTVQDMFSSLTLIMRAWNATREGASLKKIPVVPGKDIPDPK